MGTGGRREENGIGEGRGEVEAEEERDGEREGGMDIMAEVRRAV